MLILAWPCRLGQPTAIAASLLTFFIFIFGSCINLPIIILCKLVTIMPLWLALPLKWLLAVPTYKLGSPMNNLGCQLPPFPVLLFRLQADVAKFLCLRQLLKLPAEKGGKTAASVVLNGCKHQRA